MPKRFAALTLGVVTACLTGTLPAGAQYFGRNKVQYEEFDFRILETPHFEIYYYEAEREATEYAARLAERWYARLSHVLGHEFRERQPIVLYASHSHFVQTTVVQGTISEGVGGVTEHQKGRVILPFAAGLGETDHVLGHELVHAFQRDILRQRNRSLMTLPLWFVEGMAEYLTVGRLDANTAMWIRDAAADNRLPAIGDLNDPRWFPYRYGQALWSYLAGRFGEQVVVQSLKSLAPGGAIGRITAVTGADEAALTAGWHRSIAAQAEDADDKPRAPSTPLIAASRGGGRLNVGPALSPDGKEIVFLSERDEYSIDVYLADATSGAIKRRLVQTAADPHFDSLQFIGSAGAWDRTGKRFVFAAVHRGSPVLTILNMQTGEVEREIVIDDLDEAFGPSWSPDGRQVAFSALKDGLSDLYVLQVDTGKVRALTTDAFADLQPAWSPDGQTIAFATDRFSSSLAMLSFGNYRLGAFDLSTERIRELPAIPAAKHIDPSWSADGSSLYFIADRDERSNVHRLEIATGELFQVTAAQSGVSGITALSPALSLAQDADRMAYTVYRHGAYELHVGKAEKGTPLPRPPARAGGQVATRLPGSAVQLPTFGLIDDKELTVKPYTRGLSFNGLGQPYLSAGGGSIGSFVRAGVSLSFGDMLGEQSLLTALQVGKGMDDFAARAAYVNRRSRWNWAISAGQVPSVLGASRSFSIPATADAPASVVTEDVVLRQIHRQMNGTVIYPFSRARRVELTAGLHTVAFDRRSTKSVYSRTGDLLEETHDTASPDRPVALFETGAALVHDSALVGPTSPILGNRYRFEIAPTLGDITVATVLADYRRYLMPVRPFTLALRLKHLGRYGPGAGDTRLLPLAYNLRDTVRGHDTRTLTTHACGEAASADCEARRHLSMRQLFAGNVELRFPVIGAFRGSASYGRLPLEGFAFVDSGWFWSRPLRAETRVDRMLLSSAGAGVRVNAAGMVFEIAAARPLAGSENGWGVAVNFRPGF